MEKNCLQVICRTAQPGDTGDVLALTKTIWDGEDYVPEVWDEWLADPSGRLIVAEYEGKVIGLCKLTRLSEQEWWLEGMRVDPAFQGHGVASQLHDEMIATWKLIGGGTVRLMTMATRLPVHHLCARTGFTRVGEYGFFNACTQVEPAVNPAATASEPLACPETPGSAFQPVTTAQAAEASAYALASPIQELTGDLIDLGWQLATPQIQYLQAAAGKGQAWWWRSRQGLVVTLDDDEDQPKPRLMIGLLACPPTRIVPMLLDLRRLAAGQGYAEVFWTARLHPDLLPHIEAAGFSRGGENSVYVFAKQKT